MLTVHEFDIGVIEAVQDIGGWLRPVMEVFSALGATAAYSAIALIIYWCINAKIGLRLAVMVPLTGVINAALKLGFHEPRPFWVDHRVDVYYSDMGFGMPSGHAQSSVSFWGLVAYIVHRRTFTLLLGALVLFIGLSRIYLGLHSLMQVLCGFGVGAVVLTGFIRLEPKAVAAFKRLTTRWRIICSQIIPLGFILLGAVIINLLGDWEVPDGWDHHFISAGNGGLISPMHLTGIVDNSGLLSGVLLGAVIVVERGSIPPPGFWRQRLLRVGVGACGVLMVLVLRGVLLDGIDQHTAADYLVRYGTGTMAGVWAVGLSPVLFGKLRL